jgi:hypothetical protein
MTVDKNRLRWLCDRIIEINDITARVKEAVEEAVRDYFERPAGEVIDELLAMAGDEGADWPAKDRDVFRRLAADLNEALQGRERVADTAETVANDVLGDINAWDFRQLAEEYDAGPEWPEVAGYEEDDEDDGGEA